ncbi:hypothetical protein K461DRAFT_279058 [Myriangium duriaei CBS 260.36]|uniref:Uncharacterized protein n=1 Tax=Myriangium duriaei CBS 260.36 TaxID=1168546 RepID=A0A9P4MFW7_9PEZI|nr:hypothetical protein K461DRAFT_279058 [Myriangium duriaei CBS 260.36]
MACISLTSTGFDTISKKSSLIHYGQALRGLTEELSLGIYEGEEWQRATVILCHLFETLQQPQSTHSAPAHLSGAHALFQRHLHASSPVSVHSTLLLEGYITHTTNNCLFQPLVFEKLPFHYVQNLLQSFRGSLAQLRLSYDEENCPWLGVYGLDIIGYVYKLSWLTKRMPLDSRMYAEAKTILNDINTDSSLEDPNFDCVVATSHPKSEKWEWIYHTRQVFRQACTCLAATLVQDDGLDVTSDNENRLLLGAKLLNHLTDRMSPDPLLLWPLVVIGSLASLGHTRDICIEIIGRHELVYSSATVLHITNFWHSTWSDPEQSHVFRKDELLERILL